MEWLIYIETFLPLIKQCFERNQNDFLKTRQRLRRPAIALTVRRLLRTEDGLSGLELRTATRSVCEALASANDEDLNELIKEAQES